MVIFIHRLISSCYVVVLVCFARPMHSTAEFATTVLIKCVCVDHLHRCKTSFGCSRFSCFNIRFAGGTGPLWIPVPTKLFHNGGSGD